MNSLDHFHSGRFVTHSVATVKPRPFDGNRTRNP
jgi:hypothetical protein